MDDAPHPDESRTDEPSIGMHITSDPDRTEIEQPETFGARERASAPFRILLVSDLVPQRSGPVDWSDGTHVHRVDTNRFAAFMAEMAPQCTVDVPNVLGETPKKLDVSLSFTALDDFRPGSIARQIPVLAHFLDVRDLIQAVGDGDMELEVFRERLETLGVDADWTDEMYRMLAGDDAPEKPSAPPSSPSEEEDDSLNRLLGMVDVEDDEDDGTPASAPVESPPANGDVGSMPFVDALMDAVSGRDASRGVEPSAVERLLVKVDRMLADQVTHVLEHPTVRRLEAAWRGLKFLVDRLNVREGIQLVVLPCGRGDLHEAMHHQVIVPEHRDDRDEPSIALILLDDAFGRGYRDIEQLTDLAETGESLQTPLVASVSPDFFGLPKMSGLAKLPTLRPHLQGSEYAEWKALRANEASQFLALALPSFLLRYPYGPDRPADAFAIDESEGLWGGAALAVGALAAQSFADTGWPTHLANYAVENLPVQPGRGGHSPLAALLPGSKQSELARAGFVVLSAKPNHDAVRITHVSMVQRPETYDDPAATAEARAHASLPCRLFVARAAHHLLAVQDEIEESRAVASVQHQVASAMRSLLGVDREPVDDAPPHVTVEHVTNVDLPEHELLAVRVQPPATVLDKRVRLVMGVQVRAEAPSEAASDPDESEGDAQDPASPS